MEILTEGIKEAFTETIILPEVTETGLAHKAFDIKVQVITSPSAIVVDEKVTPVSPLIGLPFLFHWKDGIGPPLVGVAVKTIEDPEQEGLLPLVIEIPTEGVTTAFNDINIFPEVADAGLAQMSFELIVHVITSPSTRSVVV